MATAGCPTCGVPPTTSSTSWPSTARWRRPPAARCRSPPGAWSTIRRPGVPIATPASSASCSAWTRRRPMPCCRSSTPGLRSWRASREEARRRCADSQTAPAARSLLRRREPCLAHGLLQVLALLAARWAQAGEDGEVLPGLVRLPGLDVELAQVFVGALVIGVEVERLAVVGERARVVARLAQREAQ